MTKETTTTAMRLRDALAARGIDIRHSEARQIAAFALGHRSTNEMDAVSGDLPIAEAVDEVPDLLALRDPTTGAVFAVDPRQASAGRLSGSIVSPYGGLLAMPRPAPAPHAPVLELTAMVDREEGFLYWSNDHGWGDFAGADLVDQAERHPLPDLGISTDRVFRIPLQHGRSASRPDHVNRAHDALVAALADRPITASDAVRIANLHPARREGRSVLMAMVDGCEAAVRGYLGRMDADFVLTGIEPVQVGERHILLVPAEPFERAFDGTQARLALEDLLLPTADRPRVVATFNPEAWINDYAVPVDPKGDTDLDVTFEILLMGRTAALELDDNNYDSDELRYGVRAPEWVRDWGGPFTVHVEDAIRESGIYEE